MATRTKTVEFATTTDVGPIAASLNIEKSISIYIPEDSPTFISCMLQVYTTMEVSATNLDTPVLGIDDGSVTWDDVTLPNAISGSGESEWYMFRRDVTGFFIANFDGATPPTTVNWDVRFRSGDNTGNHAFKLILTYEYDDAATTQIKTVKIPINSDTGFLGTSYATVGGATSIPDIGGSYLPETSVAIRQVWLEMMAGGAGSSARINDLRVDGGADVTWYDTDSVGSETPWQYGQVDITAEDLTVARSLEAKSTVTNSVPHLGGLVCVTYEFNASTSTKIMNSCVVPLTGQSFIGYQSNGSVEQFELNVQEPLTADATPSITLLESAVVGFSLWDVRIAVGTQINTDYNQIDNTSNGLSSFVHRFDDAGLAQGAYGGTFARGLNTIETLLEPLITNGETGVQGYAVLNYLSGKSSKTVGAHNHTTFFHLRDSSNSNTASAVAFDLSLAETNYYLQGVMAEIIYQWDNEDDLFGIFSIERLSSEGSAAWISFYQFLAGNQAENVTTQHYVDMTKVFKRWPEMINDAGLVDQANTHRFLVWQLPLPYNTYGIWQTYHGIATDADVVIAGYTGDGSGITASILRVSDECGVDQVTTVTGGTATGVVYDDTVNYRAVAQQGARSGSSISGAVV